MARDPGSLYYLPLAEFYRRQGHRHAAMRLCLRGLERNPEHTGGHGLLARLYLEGGDRTKAYDEWGIVLRLDDDNFEANRGLGFYHLEHGDLARARAHLLRATEARPEDPLSREALALARQREGTGSEGAAAAKTASEPGPSGAPPLAGTFREASTPTPPSAGQAPASRPGRTIPPPGAAGATSGGALPRDPARLFGTLEGEVPFVGALLLDDQGLVLAGGFAGDGRSRSESLGAALGGAIEEAQRAADLLRLGAWKGVLLHAREAVLHIGPLGDDHVVLLAAAAETPTGWVLRAATRAASLAQRFLEATRG